MMQREKLLWVDGTAGAVVGMLLLSLSPWLAPLFRLPLGIVLFMGLVNLTYGCYSLTIARFQRRPLSLIRFLVIANLAWVPVCIGLALTFRETISIWGLLHLSAEAMFVGSLAVIEWRWRDALVRP
ncbi:MAG: hypothetical protein RhofKO_27840 [Rhodothermales bacterium]